MFVPVKSELVSIKEVPGLKKNQIYDKTLAWMAENFRSSKSVIELKDRENGKIIGQAIGNVSDPIPMYDRAYGYTLIIDIKDYKIKVTFKNFRTEQIGNIYGASLGYDYHWEQIETQHTLFVAKLLGYLTGKKSENKDW